MIMAPAAYHRQAERGQISRYFVDLASNLLTWALAPLLLGIVLEVFLIARIVLNSIPISCGLAAVMLTVFTGLWFVFPRLKAKRRRTR
jgi:C4-dicarboxylate transporter